MADDIDIEEHDVLENPRIKNIFPDLTRIKIEVPDSDDEGQPMQNDLGDESGVSSKSPLQLNQALHNNHIILGSKRSVDLINYEDSPELSNCHFSEDNVEDNHIDEFGHNIQIKEEPQDSHDEEIERHGSCIILGSKPNTSPPEKESHDVYSSIVMLENWGPRLQRSSCYCKVCRILFATRNCLDAHKMATHSFLVALSNDIESPDKSQPGEASVSVNRAMKSTAKILQSSRKSSLSDPSTSNGKFCNHCQQMFPNETVLIKHLYENLTAQKSSCNTETELIRHDESHDTEDEDEHDDDDTSDESNGGLYFRCDVCFCYCMYSLTRHMKNSHGKSTFSKKKVPFRGDCKFCSSEFSKSKYLTKHIRNMHSQYFYKRVSSKSTKHSKVLKSKGTLLVNSVKTNSPSDSQTFHFKCMECDEVFSTYGTARYHKSIKHPEMRNHEIFCKIKRTQFLMEKLIKKSVKDKKEFMYNGVSNPPIPKSVLFKCDKCIVYFQNCIDAVFHSCKSNDNPDVWECDVCSKRFKFGDKIIHERQHIVSDRFKVHLIDKSVYGRTLCQCPKCKVYYSEQEFWVHVKQGCGQPKSVPCKICKILIHVSSLQMHEILHKKVDFSARDLILIEFVPFENEDTEGNQNMFIRNKRKIPVDNNAPDSKKSKISTVSQGDAKSLRKISKKIYYCEKCKNCWTASRLIKYHRTGKCELLKKKSRACKKCGLFYSSNCHDMMVHKSDETIFDFTFIRVQDNKIINPMPSYPMCSKCKIHFLNKKARRQHDCNNATTDHKICEYCKKRFSVAAYRLHVTFHEYAFKKKRQNKTGIINKENRSMTKQSLSVMEKSSILSPITESSSGKSPAMPELLKNYKLWTQNILYSCEVCDIVCSSYDKMVEHSQDHLNKMESYDMTIENCEICDLRFDETCFAEHKDLHDENTTLSRQSFKTLKYNYMNLFSDNWFDLFGTLPPAQIEKIVSQSIYVHDRNIRMRITQHGPPENTVYKCGRCNGYLTASMVGAHFEKSNCWPPRYKCKLCHLDFSMNICLKEHENFCRITKQTFREVIFNDINDVTFNKGLQVKQQSEKSLTIMTQIKARGSIYRLYECEICKCCIKLKSVINFHKCLNPSLRVKCELCDLFFNKQSLYRHRSLHKKLPKLSKRTVMTIPFKPESFKVLPKLYKCQCGLHFTSLQTAEKHLTQCEPKNQIYKENCSKCGLLFPTSVLVSHLCSHHSTDKQTEFDIQQMAPKKKKHGLRGVEIKTSPKITIYKCAQCDVCYLSHKALVHHFDANHKSLLTIVHCDLCNVNFTKNSMTRHTQLHHSLPKYSRSNLSIKVYGKHAQQLIAESVKPDDVNSQKSTILKKCRHNYDRYLYQCKRCKINFLSNDACISHYKKFHEESKGNKQKSDNCDICGLALSLLSMARHVRIHHEIMRLNRGDLIIIPSGVINKHSKDLYKCETCNVHFLSHESYVKHCLKGIHSINKIACQICNYNFTETSIKQHIENHHNLQKLHRKDFNIVTEVFDKTGREESHHSQDLEMNESSIADENITRYQAEKDQNSNAIVTNRLYRCRTCSVHFCKESHLIHHVSVSGHNQPAAICKYCHLKFTPGNGIDLHINEHHNTLKLTKNEFIIIENDNIDGAYASRYLYKCNECFTHFVTEANAEQHVHAIGKRKCRACGLLFSSVELDDHKSVHHNLMQMSLDDFRCIIDVKRKSHHPEPAKIEKTRKRVTMYKLSEKYKSTLNLSNYDNTIYLCRCGLYIPRLMSFKKHIRMCNGEICASGSKANCGICGLLFSAQSLSIHHYIHHENFNFKLEDLRILTEKDIEQSNVTQSKTLAEPAPDINMEKTRKRVTMYKLSKKYKSTLKLSNYDNTIYLCRCGLYFPRLMTFKKHITMCNGEICASGSKADCGICGLLFSAQSLSVHQYIQHENFNFKLEDFRILTEKDIEQPVTQSKTLAVNNYLGGASSVSQTDSTEKENPPSKISEVLQTTEISHKTVRLSNYSLNANLDNSSTVGHTDTTQQEQTPPKTADSSKSLERVRPSRFSYNLSESQLSSLNMDNYSNQLYKCKVCQKHYIYLETALRHGHDAQEEKCDTCGLGFTSHTVSKHRYIHHERLGLNLADFHIHHVHQKTENLNSKNVLYKCDICDTHFLKFTSAHAHTDEQCTITISKRDLICKDCGLNFSESSLQIHAIEHHLKNNLKAEDFNIIHYSGATRKSITNSTDFDESGISTGKTEESEKRDVDQSETNSFEDLDLNVSKPSSTNSLKKCSEKVKIKLYKCGPCNVFYVNQNSCYKHMLNHKKLDSMEFIECKLCGLQFRILTLHKHMIKHHKVGFDLKNVLVEEYNIKKDKTLKIDIYNALDKIQFRLVSTTTDSKDVSEGKADSTVDIVRPVDDDEEHLGKVTTYKNVFDPFATNSAVKNISDSTVTENIDQIDINLVREQIVTESAVQEGTHLKTVLKITSKDDCHLSVDQVVSTSNLSVNKDIIDSTVHRTESKIKVKDKIDHVVKQMVTDSTVESISNPSIKQVDTESDEIFFLLNTDKYITNSAVHKTVSESKEKDIIDMVTLSAVESISNPSAKQADSDSDVKHFIVPSDANINDSAVHKTVSEINVKDKIDMVTLSTVEDISNASTKQVDTDSDVKHCSVTTTDKDITVSSAVHKTVSELKVKDIMDHVVKQMVSDSSVEDKSNPSAKQADTDSDVLIVAQTDFIVPTIDITDDDEN